jgi:hypothetical protein
MTDTDDRAVADKLHLEVQLLLLDTMKRRQDLSTEWWKVCASLIGAVGAWGAILALVLRPHGS